MGDSIKGGQAEQRSPVLIMHAAPHAPGILLEGGQPCSLPLHTVLPLTRSASFLHALRRAGHCGELRNQHGLAYSRCGQRGGQRLNLRMFPFAGSQELQGCCAALASLEAADDCGGLLWVSCLLVGLPMPRLCSRRGCRRVVEHRGLGDFFCSAHWQAGMHPCILSTIVV